MSHPLCHKYQISTGHHKMRLSKEFPYIQQTSPMNTPLSPDTKVSLPPRELTFEESTNKRLQTLESKLASMETRLKEASAIARSATRRHIFHWGNEEKFTRKEYEWFVTQQYFDGLHRFPNLRHPKRLGEKILWLKLHYQHPLMSTVTDKYRVKQYVTEQIGGEYIIPLLGVWDNVWDIDLGALPNRFVIKCNNWAGGKWGNYIIRDKAKMNRDVVLYNLENWIQNWQDCFYHAVIEARRKPVVFAEKYMADSKGSEQLRDFKFMCFHGEPLLFWIDADRATEHKRNLYDTRGNLLPARLTYPNFTDDEKAMPQKLGEMLELARALSRPFPHMRVDFYEVDGEIYFGEFTPHTDAGLLCLTPDEWDFKLGEALDLKRCEKEYLVEYPAAKDSLPYTGEIPS